MALTKMKSIIFFAVLNVSIILAAVFYNILFLRGKVGECKFLEVFHLYCPGCGGSRSLNALLKFDLFHSFIYYPAIPITSLIILDIDVRLIISAITGKNILKGMRRWIFILIPVSIILSFLIKNILLLSGIDILGNII